MKNTLAFLIALLLAPLADLPAADVPVKKPNILFIAAEKHTSTHTDRDLAGCRQARRFRGQQEARKKGGATPSDKVQDALLRIHGERVLHTVLDIRPDGKTVDLGNRDFTLYRCGELNRPEVPPPIDKP